VAGATSRVDVREKPYLLFALAVCIVAAPVYAGPTTPPPGSAERKAICDALRMPVMKEFGVKPVFVVQTLVVMDGWAFMAAGLQREDGTAYNVEEAHRQRTGEGDALSRPFDGDDMYGLLRKANGRWKVMACAVSPTDVAYADWRTRFGAPKAVFGSLAVNVE